PEARSLGGVGTDGFASARRRTSCRGATEHRSRRPAALSALRDAARAEPGVLPGVRSPASCRRERARPTAQPSLAEAVRLVPRRLGVAVALGTTDRGARRHRRRSVRVTRSETRRLRNGNEPLRAASDDHRAAGAYDDDTDA